MKNILIIALIAAASLTSCNQKENKETENSGVQTSDTIEQVQIPTDSTMQAEQEKMDTAHGHTH